MKKLILSASLLVSGLLAYTGSAQITQYWDNNGTTAPTSGNWDTNSTFWNSVTNLLTASPVAFTNGNFAAFAVGAGTISSLTITVPGIVTCTGIGDGTPSGAAVTTLTFSGAGTINFPSGLWNIDCGASANTLVFNVPIVGSGGIAQHNSGSLSLYANNTYTGGTAETGGQIINYNNNNSFGTGWITNYGGNAIYLCTNSLSHLVTITNAWYLNIGANIWDFGDGNTTLTGPVALYSTTQLKNNGAANTPLTLSGPISSVGGAFGLTLETPNGSSIILSGANTYTGPTFIGLAGATASVTVSNINSVANPPQQTSSSLGVPSSAANGIIQMGYGTGAGKLIYVGPGETNDRAINMSGQTGGAIIEMDGTGPLVFTSAFTATTNGAKPLTLQGSSTAANAINGAIVNSSSGATVLTKGQTGTWDLGGLNTFTGGINVSNGTLAITGSGDLGNSGGNGSYAGAITNNGTFVYSSSAAQTLSGTISGAGALQQIGSGNLTLSGADTYTGATTIGGGSTLILSGTGKTANNTPITLNGTLNVNSTAGQNVDLVAGSGAFNQNAVATSTLTNLNDTFSGLFTVTAGTISFNSDGCLGTPPASYLANDITLNGGPAANLRANANNIIINANRGITLGANGGAIQVAGNDTCTYNGIITGSGQFQNGANATTGLGILVLGADQPYTNTTVLCAGTLRLPVGAAIGNSAGILISNTATLDVSALNPFTLSTTNTFTVIGNPTNMPTIIGASGGTVDFGAQPVSLSYVPALTTGQGTNGVLTISQAALNLNGNTVNVTNATALALDVGSYTLIRCTNGINVNSPLTLNYFGPIVPNVSTSLAVVSGSLVLQVSPAAGYTGTTFTNLTASQSVPYGTATATVSGTVSAAGPTYPAMGETVTITIPLVTTNTTTIDDTTGDFTLTIPINTFPVGSALITYSYSGPTLGSATDSSTTFTITKAPVTVTATAQSKTYGQTITFGAGQTAFTATGLQNGDTIGTVTLAVSGSPAGGVSNAPVSGSPYTITPSAATGGTFVSGDYTITYATGLLTVNPLPVGLTGTRYCDGTATANFSILSITNVVGTDDVSLASGSATLASSAVGPEAITSAAGLTLAGTTAGNYTTTGAIGSVTVTTNPNATNIVSSVSNGVLTLSWPVDHTGWTLQAQTNSVSVGISNNWMDFSGSAATNVITMPVDPNNGCVFYRLYYTP